MGRFATSVGAVMIAIMQPSAIASDDGGTQSERSQTTSIVPPPTEKVVCKREPVIGSHFTKRVCRTVSQERAEREAAKDLMDAMGRSASQVRGPGE